MPTAPTGSSPARRSTAGRGRLPVLWHPPRRSERRRAPRAPPRAARLRHVLRLAQSRRFEVDQHARHAGRRRAAGRLSGTICWISVRPSAAPACTRAKPFEGWEYLVEGKKTAGGIPPSASTSRTGGRCRSIARARSARSPSTTRAGIPRSGSRDTPTPHSGPHGWTTSSGRHDGCRDSPTRCCKALPRVGQFDDPKSEEMLAKFLIDRRDAIVRRYLPAVNPSSMCSSRLGYPDVQERRSGGGLARLRPSTRSVVAVRQRHRYDNADWRDERAGNEHERRAPPNLPSAPRPTSAWKSRRTAARRAGRSRSTPTSFERLRAGGCVGFERVPVGNAPRSIERVADVAER